jgi:hypothetical protein
MISKETYTKIFLKQCGKAVNDVTVAEYFPIWWQNIRSGGGLRLTNQGYMFITEELELTIYEVPFPKDFDLTTQTIIFLDRFIDCPYYLGKSSIIVTDEKKALELHLFSGDIRKYGLTKALKRQEKDSKSG